MNIKLGDKFTSGHTKDEILTVVKTYDNMFTVKVGNTSRRILCSSKQGKKLTMSFAHLPKDDTILIKKES